MKAPSLSSSSPLSRESVRVATRTMKLAKAYYGDLGSNSTMKSSNLSSTLEKLYEWEKKLYKEVKVLMKELFILFIPWVRVWRNVIFSLNTMNELIQ